MHRLALVVVLVVVCTGCKEVDPTYCGHSGNFGQGQCPDAPTIGGSCKVSNDCAITADFPVCDLTDNGGTCVQCTNTEQNACNGATPVCLNNHCRQCTQHAQCSSHACLPDGTCADSSLVAYVRPNGSGTTCTQMSPCGTLTDGVTAKAIVKIEGTITDIKATTIDAKTIQIIADPGAHLTRDTNGVILEVKNDQADVSIYDLEITGGVGAKTDPALSLSGGSNPKLALTRVKIDSNVGIGILATSGTLTATRCTISDNGGGGISVTGSEFDLTNNYITGNGSPNNGFGGVIFNQTNMGKHIFEFNTVTDNSAMIITGVTCLSVAQPATFSNNIIFDNQVGSGRTQTGDPNCNWTFSDIGDSASATSTVTPEGNRNVDPLFISPTTKDYHLKPGSPIKNTADTAATINIDFDGDARPQEGRRDMGADEIVPAP